MSANAQHLDDLGRRIVRLVQAEQPGVEDITVTNLEALSGGNARRAFAFHVAWTVAGGGRYDQDCVLLGRDEAGQVESDPRQEFETLCALEHTGVSSPRPLWLDASGETLGMPGFIMTRGEGRSSIRELLHPESVITLPLLHELASTAVNLHAVDWKAKPFPFAGDEGPGEAALRQIEEWEQQFCRQRLEPLPALASIFRWLRLRQPRSRPTSVVHGDFRLGNFLYEGTRITLLLDWEMAHLGDPAEDLAWAYRQMWSPEHFLSFDEWLELYAKAGGVRVDARTATYWRIYSEAKFAVISLTATRTYVEGRTENLRLAARASMVVDSVERSMQWIEQMERQ